MTTWRKSTRSGGGGNDNNCVEVSHCAEDGFHLRDSKLSADSPVFDLSPKDFSALLHAAG